MTKPTDSKQAIPSPEDRVRAIREREQSVCKHCQQPKGDLVHSRWAAPELHHKFEPVAEPASTGEQPDYCQCGAIGLDSSGKCAVCREPVPGAESDRFSAIIKCHTQEALDKLHDPEKLRMLIGASIDALMLQEEIDYTLEVRRDYK